MPSQKPLIDLDQLDRNRGSQLAALDGLAHRLTSGIARDGYKVSVQTLVSLMRVFDSLASPQRPETWHGIQTWAAMAGISKEQCGRAISVLKSLDLITARVTWVAFGKRGMKVAINWSTIFTTGPITQAPEDVTAWTAKKTRQRNLFAKKRTPRTPDVMTVSENVTVTVSENHTMTVSETGVVTVSSISNPHRYPLTHPQGGEWVGGDSELTTEARRHKGTFDASQRNQQATPHVGASTATEAAENPRAVRFSQPDCHDLEAVDRSHLQTLSPTETAGRKAQAEGHSIAADPSPSVPPCLSGSHPMRPHPVPPADLIQQLVALDVADARSAVKKSLTAGYSLDQIRAIVGWYQGQGLPDEAGKLVYPYTPGQLVMRLRDPDGITAAPSQGNWSGGKSGFWTRLAPISTPKPRNMPRPATPTTKPDRNPVPTTYMTAMSLSEIHAALDDRGASPAVRASADRAIDGKPLPKTLALWLKANGFAVDERAGTRDESQQEGES